MEFKFFRNHLKIKALKIEFFKAFFICTQILVKYGVLHIDLISDIANFTE